MTPHDPHDPSNDAAAEESPRKDPAASPVPQTDPEAGMEREVGDLENPDAEEDEGALQGRMGGGLAGS